MGNNMKGTYKGRTKILQKIAILLEDQNVISTWTFVFASKNISPKPPVDLPSLITLAEDKALIFLSRKWVLKNMASGL